MLSNSTRQHWKNYEPPLGQRMRDGCSLTFMSLVILGSVAHSTVTITAGAMNLHKERSIKLILLETAQRCTMDLGKYDAVEEGWRRELVHSIQNYDGAEHVLLECNVMLLTIYPLQLTICQSKSVWSLISMTAPAKHIFIGI